MYAICAICATYAMCAMYALYAIHAICAIFAICAICADLSSGHDGDAVLGEIEVHLDEGVCTKIPVFRCQSLDAFRSQVLTLRPAPGGRRLELAPHGGELLREDEPLDKYVGG